MFIKVLLLNIQPYVASFKVHHGLHTNRAVRARAYHLSVIDMHVPLLQTWFLFVPILFSNCKA